MPQQPTPWAILLCRFNDDAREPFPRQHYENLFTNAGTGLNNLVDFFRLYSHGNIDIGGSEVFGWIQLPHARSEYTGSGANPAGRNQLVQWARDAATATGVDLSRFHGVVVCMNVSTDLFGGGGAVVTPNGDVNNDMSPSMLAQEMLHGYGVDHSRADGSEDDYRDPWDAMSTAVFPTMASHPDFYRIGPGLNAANMAGRGWLDPRRVWNRGGFFNETVMLRPHHRRDLAGFLIARVGRFFVEFRMREGWDAAIARPAVLVHRFEANRSYLMASTTGDRDMAQGSVFQQVDQSAPQRPATRVEVTSIDPGNRQATIQISYQPTVQPTTVPDVREMEQADAASAIRAADLVPSFTGATGPDAWVWSQSPRAGAVVDRGSTVICQLRTGPVP
jgi:PASTA domain